MNSKERHELRYQRRVAKRNERKRQLRELCDDYNAVFTLTNLYKSWKLNCKGTTWKDSVQKYNANAMINLVNTFQTMKKGNFKSKGFHEFDIKHRGRLRHIKSVSFDERVIQRCLCDYCLVPLLSRDFVYDNSACQKGKGVDFAIKRMVKHLRQHYRIYGRKGYILQYDFSKYFDNLTHMHINEIIDKYIKDERLSSLTKQLVADFGEVGLGTGGQISSILALAYTNELDHIMKEALHCRFYGRYMDDGYIISNSKEEILKCLEALKEVCKKLDIKLNEKKTHITKLTHGFTFLKIKFYIEENGRIVKKIARESVVRMRRKLKKMHKRVIEGKMKFEDVICSVQSWIGHTKKTNSYHTRMSIIQLFNRLFKDYITGGKICLKY